MYNRERERYTVYGYRTASPLLPFSFGGADNLFGQHKLYDVCFVVLDIVQRGRRPGSATGRPAARDPLPCGDSSLLIQSCMMFTVFVLKLKQYYIKL